MKCAVANRNSKNHIKGVKKSFFTFPKEQSLLEKWIEFCQRNEPFDRKSWRMCIDHFQDSDICGALKNEMGKRNSKKQGVVLA